MSQKAEQIRFSLVNRFRFDESWDANLLQLLSSLDEDLFAQTAESSNKAVLPQQQAKRVIYFRDALRMFKGIIFCGKNPAVKGTKEYEEQVVRLKQVLRLTAILLYRQTSGEYAYRVMNKSLPNLIKMIRTLDDFVKIYTYAEAFFKIYSYVAEFLILSVIPQFSELFHESPDAFLECLLRKAKKQKFKEAFGTIIDDEIWNFIFFLKQEGYINIKTVSDFEEMLGLAEGIRKKWESKFSDALRLIDVHATGRSGSDIKCVMRFMQKGRWVFDGFLFANHNFDYVVKEEAFFMQLMDATEYPEILFKILPEFISKDFSQFKKYPKIINSVVKSINTHPEEIAAYEHNLLKIMRFFTSPAELEYFMALITVLDANFIHNLFNILTFLGQENITNFRVFIENGGLEIIKEIEHFKAIKTDAQILNFCGLIIEAYNPRNYAELIRIFNVAFIFANKEVKDTRTKLQKLENVTNITPSIFRYFGDYLLYMMEYSPKNFMTLLTAISRLLQVNANIKSDLLQFARASRTFSLFLGAKTIEKTHLKDIENTYIFLNKSLGRIPAAGDPRYDKLMKSFEKNLAGFRKSLEKIGTEHSKSAFDEINNIILNLSVLYFAGITKANIKNAFMDYCGQPLPEELIDDENAVNALIIAKKCEKSHNMGETARNLIKEICLKNTSPFKKYPEAYPYNHPANILFIKEMESRGLNLNYWINGCAESYAPIYTDVIMGRENKIIQQVMEIIDECKAMGLDPAKDEIFKDLDKLQAEPNNLAMLKIIFNKASKLNESSKSKIIGDIKMHLKEISSLQGSNIHISTIKKVIIYLETNPLNVLQMGNWVGGSCLSINGSNSWTTITNAVDVNKRVLYAKDEKGKILGRRLIAMNDDCEIVQFGGYNNLPEIDLEVLFEKFAISLAEKCNAGLSDSQKDIPNLVAKEWYAGTPAVPFRQVLAKAS